MKQIKRRLQTFAVGAGLLLALALAVPTGANAADETLDADFSLEPRSGSLLNNGLKPANWKIDTNVTAHRGPRSFLRRSSTCSFPQER